MKKSEFIIKVSEKTGLDKNQVSLVTTAIFDEIIEILKAGDSIRFYGFGSFKSVKRAARVGYNPKAKKSIMLPARNAVKFSATDKLKKNLNEVIEPVKPEVVIEKSSKKKKRHKKRKR